MAPDLVLILLLSVFSVNSLKYVYVNFSYYWNGAQEHCRNKFTDLAPVSGVHDMFLLRQASGTSAVPFIWFGLMKNTTYGTKWMWSGGAEATTFFWDDGQPDTAFSTAQNFGILINYKWHDSTFNYVSTHFLCYTVQAVREKKTWEQALEFCRKTHQDLASVASETEMMLMQKELQKLESSTQHVWVGLRFLAEEWLWMDRQPLDYQAWGPNEQPQCPAARCGALRVSETSGNTENIVRVEKIKEWNVRDCTERLHFLCY